MRTLIYSVEERELGRDEETSFRATHHASCLSRPILLSSVSSFINFVQLPQINQFVST